MELTKNTEEAFLQAFFANLRQQEVDPDTKRLAEELCQRILNGEEIRL